MKVLHFASNLNFWRYTISRDHLVTDIYHVSWSSWSCDPTWCWNTALDCPSSFSRSHEEIVDSAEKPVPIESELFFFPVKIRNFIWTPSWKSPCKIPSYYWTHNFYKSNTNSMSSLLLSLVSGCLTPQFYEWLHNGGILQTCNLYINNPCLLQESPWKNNIVTKN